MSLLLPPYKTIVTEFKLQLCALMSRAHIIITKKYNCQTLNYLSQVKTRLNRDYHFTFDETNYSKRNKQVGAVSLET